jgi:hypothetical protein
MGLFLCIFGANTFKYVISALVFIFGGFFISVIVMDKMPNMKGI